MKNTVKLISYTLVFISLTLCISVSGCRRPVDLLPRDPEIRFGGPILDFSLSYLPKVDETAELTFNVALNFYTYSNEIIRNEAQVHAWIEFTCANIYGSYREAKYAVQIPLEEVLVSGELSWKGNPFDYQDSVLPLSGNISLSREGMWVIKAFVKGEDFDNPYLLETFEVSKRMAITRNASAIPGSMWYDFSSLAYLSNFNYGGMVHRPIPDELLHPIITELDLSQAPLVGEEAVLTCYIFSINDVSDFYIEITFSKRQEGNKSTKVSGEHLLVSGDLSWSGNLSKDAPTQFSATIQFPSKGDWQISAQWKYPTSENINVFDFIRIHIASDLSYFGVKDWR